MTASTIPGTQQVFNVVINWRREASFETSALKSQASIKKIKAESVFKFASNQISISPLHLLPDTQ